MAAVITPAAEGMGGNFLLFYPAIPVGVGHSLPHLLSVVECEPRCSLLVTGAGRRLVVTGPLFEGIWGAKEATGTTDKCVSD